MTVPQAAVSKDVTLDPHVPIIDAHHHLWTVPLPLGGRAERRYLATELAADLASGHNIVATVYVECGSHYRTDGPTRLQPVGETEFAAKQASGISQFPGASHIRCAYALFSGLLSAVGRHECT